MFSQNDKISVRQLQALLILDIFGVGVITLPRKVAEIANQDGWLLVVFGTLLTVAYLYFICSVGEKYLQNGFFDGVSAMLSRPVGYVLSILFILKILIGLGLELRIFGEIVREVMLYNTPMVVTLTIMALIGGYGAFKGYEVRGRMGEIILPFVLVPMIFLLGLACVEADFSNLKPVLLSNSATMVRGSYLTSLGFYGAEYILLSFPYIVKKGDARKSTMLAVSLIGVILVALTMVTTAHFGVADVKRQMWPVLGLIDIVDFPGSFVERQGALVMSIWIISMFFIINAGIFFTSILARDIIKRGKHNRYIIFIIPVIIIVALMPSTVGETYKYMNLINIYVDSIFMVVLPIVLYVRGRIGEKA